MKVFVTGAAGYIGEAVSLAFRRAGHDVFGLVRNPEAPAAKNLAINEVNIIVGDLTKPETYQEIAANSDLLIHTAADYTQYDNVDNTAVNTLISAASKRGRKRVTLIYTSGILAYPDSQKVQNEDDPTDINTTFAILKTRLQREQQVLTSDVVHGVVLRPAFVYGGRSTNFVSYFAAAESGNVTVQGPDVIWSEIHIHDVADAYIKIGEAAPSVVGGQIFNLADDSRNTNKAIAIRFAQVAGYKGEITEVPLPNAFFSKSSIVDYRKATRLVGWVPKHKGLLDDAETLYRAWKASQQ